MRHWLLCCCIVLLAACQSPGPTPAENRLPPLPVWQAPLEQDHADAGRIIELASGRTLTADELVQRLQDAPYLLVGEKHDNPDHHRLQQWLLQALAQQRAQGSLVLEMLQPGQQAKVDRAQTRLRAGLPLDEPEKTLAWQPGWKWDLYGPLMLHALAQPYPVRAANLEQGELMQIYRKPPALAGALSTRPDVQQVITGEIRESHCQQIPADRLTGMLAIRQQRDRRMAQAVLAAPTPVMLLAGAFHVRKDVGIPLHLADLGASRPPVVLVLAQVGEPVSPLSADYAWFTPVQPEPDHCAGAKG